MSRACRFSQWRALNTSSVAPIPSHDNIADDTVNVTDISEDFSVRPDFTPFFDVSSGCSSEDDMQVDVSEDDLDSGPSNFRANAINIVNQSRRVQPRDYFQLEYNLSTSPSPVLSGFILGTTPPLTQQDK